MPEAEAKEAPGKSEAAPAAGLLGGTKGIIILIAAVVLEAVFFIVLLQLQRTHQQQAMPIDASGDKLPIQDVDTRTGHIIHFKDLNYSVPTPSGAVAPLAMELVIKLGLTPEERQGNKGLLPEEWTRFEEAVQKMEPFIRDRLNLHVRQQTYNQLNSIAGQEKIKSFVQDFVNSELAQMKILERKEEYERKRVIEVLIPMFYLQQ